MSKAQQTSLPTAEDLAVCVRGLKNQFGNAVVHENLQLDLRHREILGVVGASGTGKSVLLRSICGLNTPSAGQILLLSQDVANLSADQRRALEKRTGVLFQNGALFSSLTVAQNIQLPLREHYRLSQGLADEIAVMKVKLVGLNADDAVKYPAELSGGMRKRVALARALALDPEIVFLDEPTAGLDPVGAAAFDLLIKDLCTSLGLTVFMVTHDLDSLHSVCDRIAVLADRRVLVTGTIEQLLQFDHPWVQAYFRGPRGRAAASSYNH